MDTGTSSNQYVPGGDRIHRKTTTKKLDCYTTHLTINSWLAVKILVIARDTVMSAAEQACIACGPNIRKKVFRGLEGTDVT
jgi:hypothetical protein